MELHVRSVLWARQIYNEKFSIFNPQKMVVLDSDLADGVGSTWSVIFEGGLRRPITGGELVQIEEVLRRCYFVFLSAFDFDFAKLIFTNQDVLIFQI